MRFDSFVGASYTLSSIVAELQRAMNQYPELDETKQGKNFGRMVGTPGITLLKNLATIDAAATPGRGLWSAAGRLFVAAGTKYFEVDQTGTLVGIVKTIADDGTHTPVQFLANGQQLAIVSADHLYVDNPAGPIVPTMIVSTGGKCDTFTIVGAVNAPGSQGSIARHTDSTGGPPFSHDMDGKAITINGVAGTYTFIWMISEDWGLIEPNPGPLTNVNYVFPSTTVNMTARTGTFLDGYLIVSRPPAVGITNRQFNIAALGDFLTWDQLDFDIKSGYPDELVAVFADHQELWLFGAETIEIWRNTGNADFPFQRDPSAVIHYGCGSPLSPVSINGHVGWLGTNSVGSTVAYLANGFVPQRVSTHAVEQAWKTSGFNMKFATSFPYEDNGHYFWVISLKGTRTWVYDLTTQQWHERAYVAGGVYTGEASLLSAKYHHHTFIPEWGANGQHIVLSYDDGKLYILDEATYNDDGNYIYRDRTLPHISTELKNQFVHRVQIDIETGPQISGSIKPVVSLTQSRDGGKTFLSSRILSGDIRSDPPPRVFWRQLGRARDWVCRFTVLGKSKYAAINAFLEKTDGTA